MIPWPFVLLLLFVCVMQASKIARQERVLRDFDKRARRPRVMP